MTARAPSLRRVDEATLADPKRLAQLLTAFFTDTSNALGGALALGNMRVVLYTLDVTMPPRWTTPSLGSGWATFSILYNDAGYWKDADGRVYLRGGLAGGTYGSTPIFTLPEGYRPEEYVVLPAAQSSVFAPAGQVEIRTNGDVIAAAITSVQSGTSTFLSLEGLSFDASDLSPPTLGTPFPLEVSAGGITGPLNLVVFGCEDWTGRAVQPAPYPRPAWGVSGNVVRITDLVGLAPERRYKVKIAIFGE